MTPTNANHDVVIFGTPPLLQITDRYTYHSVL